MSLHPTKTRLLEFGRFAISNRAGRGLGKPETFNFLGFTLICGRSRFGNFVIRRKTRRDRLRAKLKEIKGELRRRRHQPIPEQGRWLGQVVKGYFAYHAVPTNGRVLGTFLHHIQRLWVKSLRRRSQKDRFEWRRAPKLIDDWLPKRGSFTLGLRSGLPSDTRSRSPVRECRSLGTVRGARVTRVPTGITSNRRKFVRGW